MDSLEQKNSLQGHIGAQLSKVEGTCDYGYHPGDLTSVGSVAAVLDQILSCWR